MDLKQAKKNMEETIEFFQMELRKLRAGRANPDMVKDIKVNAYGSQMPLEQVANINIVDPTLITIQPWDKTVVEEVLKAVQSSDLGVNPSADGDLIRIPLPPLTQERRQEYVKLLKQKVEEARISIRQKRKDYLIDLSKQKEELNLPEEDVQREEKNLQEIVDEMNKKIEEIAEAKEKELLTV